MAEPIIYTDNSGVTAPVSPTRPLPVSSTGSFSPATTAAKAEDVPAVSGDVGEFILGVRNDTPSANTTDNNADYSQISVDKAGQQWTKPGAPMSSDPTLAIFENIALTSAPVLVAAGARQIKRTRINNPNAAVVFVQTFNAATAGAVTVGTTLPVEEFPVPAGATFTEPDSLSAAYPLGLVVAVTTLARGSVTPTTPVYVLMGYV